MNSWKPRIIFQGAIAVAPDRSVRSPMIEGPESPAAFIYVNPWELTPEGIQMPLDYAQRHLDEYVDRALEAIDEQSLSYFVLQEAIRAQKEGKFPKAGNLQQLMGKKDWEAAIAKLERIYPQFRTLEEALKNPESEPLVHRAKKQLQAGAELPAELLGSLGYIDIKKTDLQLADGRSFFAESATPEERKKTLRDLLTRKLEAIQADPQAFIDTVQAHKDRDLKQSWRHGLLRAADGLTDKAVWTWGSKTYRKYQKILFKATPILAGSAAFVPIHPEIALMGLMANIGAVLPLFAVPVTPKIMAQFTRLVTHPPECSEIQGDVIQKRIENKIKAYPSGTASVLTNRDPLFFISSQHMYHGGNSGIHRRNELRLADNLAQMNEVHNTIYMFATADNFIRPDPLLEELRHTVNAEVYAKTGQTPPWKEFAETFNRDMRSPRAKMLVMRYGNKAQMAFWLGRKISYSDKESQGLEALVECDIIKHNLMEEGRSERVAMEIITKAMPKTAALYVQYMTLEKRLIEQLETMAEAPPAPGHEHEYSKLHADSVKQGRQTPPSNNGKVR